jgi:hypothetical protein
MENTTTEKERIIQEILHLEDEGILRAIKKLLDIEDSDFPVWQQQILDQRIIEAQDESNLIDVEDVKKQFGR